MKDNEKRDNRNIAIYGDVHRQLKQHCNANCLIMQRVVTQLIIDYLKREK